MDTGLTLVPDTLTIMDEDSQKLESTYYTVVTNKADLTDGCTFELRFTKKYLDTITQSTTIRVHYAADLNTSALVAEKTPAVKVNQNATHLSYGDDRSTEESVVTVKTFRYQIIKVDGEDNVLIGAKFKLYRDKDGKDPIKFTMGEDADQNVKYLVDPNGTTTEIEAGSPVIYGLGNGTYYLEEIEAPAGYNRVTELKAITVSDSSSMGTFTSEDKTKYDSGVGGGIPVVNNKGALLPITGGSGTTFIYIGGALLVAVGCLLLLKWRKREKAESR
jgi:LPXTG-motif cell wall-anchored protein